MPHGSPICQTFGHRSSDLPFGTQRVASTPRSMAAAATEEILVCQAGSCLRAGSEAVLLEIEELAAGLCEVLRVRCAAVVARVLPFLRIHGQAVFLPPAPPSQLAPSASLTSTFAALFVVASKHFATHVVEHASQ